MTPHQAIADVFKNSPVGDFADEAQTILDALAAAGYQVVTNDLVEAATELSDGLDIDCWAESCDTCQARIRLAACLAAHRGDDELNVFRPEGA